MGTESKPKPHGISWLNDGERTGTTWNPVTGCMKASTGCRNCYARDLHNKRHKGPKVYKNGRERAECYDTPFDEVKCWPERLDAPLRWKKARSIFICSMGDLFHEDVRFEFIDRVLSIVVRCPQHQFFILTKRASRLREYFSESGVRCAIGASVAGGSGPRVYGADADVEPWPIRNLAVGVSICDEKDMANGKILMETPAAHRFISFEPLLEPIPLSDTCPCAKCAGSGARYWGENAHLPCSLCGGRLSGYSAHYGTGIDPRLNAIIIGAESGSQRRPTPHAWFGEIIRQANAANIPVHLKQVAQNPDGTGPIRKKPREIEAVFGSCPREWPAGRETS